MFGRRMFLWLMAVALIGTSAACSGSSTETPTQPTTPPPQGPADLQITDLVVGEGNEAVNGSTVVIHYILWHFDPNGADSKGELIVNSRTTNQPHPFIVGATSGNLTAIQGIYQGVTGMKVGGQRRLVIPPSLAYGSAGSQGGDIAPNEWVVFEIELMSSVQ